MLSNWTFQTLKFYLILSIRCQTGDDDGTLVARPDLADTGEVQHDHFRRTWALFQYPIRRLFARSRKVSNARDWVLKCSYRLEIWQAHRQQCCRCACQISERSHNSEYKSRDFETLRDLTITRLIMYWNGAQLDSIIITVTQSSWSLKWVGDCLSNRLVIIRTKKIPRHRITGLLWCEPTGDAVDSLRKAPAIRKAFLCHDVIMWSRPASGYVL